MNEASMVRQDDSAIKLVEERPTEGPETFFIVYPLALEFDAAAIVRALNHRRALSEHTVRIMANQALIFLNRKSLRF